MNQLTPRERRQARTKEDILDTALEIISESGIEGLSMRELANRVDYSPAGLYEYFDGKDDIISEVCLEGDRRLQSLMASVPNSLPVETYLVELGLAYIQFARENEEHFRLMYSQVQEGPAVPFEMLKYNQTYQILVDGVSRGIESGFIRTQPSFGLDEIAYYLWSTAHGLAVLQITSLRMIDYDFQALDRPSLETAVRGLSS